MADNNYPQYKKERRQKTIQTREERKTPIYIRQDKRGFPSTCVATNRPTWIADELHVQHPGGFSSQSKKMFNEEGPLEKLTFYVKPRVKAWTVRRAQEEDLSVSAFGSCFYEQAAQGSVDLQSSPQLKPVMVKTIRKENRRTVKLLISNSYDLQTTKQLVAYILERMPGMTRIEVEKLLKIAAKRTKEEMKSRLRELSEDTTHEEDPEEDGSEQEDK